jgi:hypothetical protein
VLKLDDEVLDAVRLEAERTGRSEDQVVEAALRRYVGPGVLDRLAARNRLPEDDAMSIALEEVEEHRRTGRDLPLTGEEFLARVQAAAPSTPDDVSIIRDGRRLDSKEAVVAWLAEVDADRAAGRYVEFDEA